MQDRTINNALLALAKQGGPQGKIADGLLELRGVVWSGIMKDAPIRRSVTKRLIMHQLQSGPKTSGQITDALQDVRTDLGRRGAYNRCYQALLRLEDNGTVRRHGRQWVLT